MSKLRKLINQLLPLLFLAVVLGIGFLLNRIWTWVDYRLSY